MSDGLQIRNLCKSFAAPVLRNIDLDVNPGEIHALLGANGAGKSTLSRIVAGLLAPDSGEMTLNGTVFRPSSRQDANRLGIQIVQQELNLLSTMTVAENMYLDRLPSRFGWINRRQLYRDSEAALRELGLDQIQADSLVAELGVGERQLVEIAGALSRPCRLLILDEPTAALTAAETELLFHQLRRLRANGTAMIYISHRLDEVRQISDRVSILRDGAMVVTQQAAQITSDEIVTHMSGTEWDTTAHAPSTATFETKSQNRPVVLRATEISLQGVLKNVSLQLHAGEKLGIAGLIGAGRTELLRVLFGDIRAQQGQMQLFDQPVRGLFRSPAEAAEAGFALVTEDRKADGALLPMSVRENTVLSVSRKMATAGGWLNIPEERTVTESMRGILQIRSQSIEQPVADLSGGNQQKVILGKWLLTQPRILLLDEPTRGIDVPARRVILGKLNELAAQGTSILMVSSDLDELMQFCDRIVVLSAGQITGEFSASEWSHDQLMQSCFAGHRGHKGDSE